MKLPSWKALVDLDNLSLEWPHFSALIPALMFEMCQWRISPWNPMYPTLSPSKGGVPDQHAFSSTTSLCGSRHAMCLPEFISNDPSFFQNALMVVAEVHLASTIRTTRTCPATILAPLREMSVGAAKDRWVLQSSLSVRWDQHKTNHFKGLWKTMI